MITYIKNSLKGFLAEVFKWQQFFKDETGQYSMGRLVTFLVTITISFDAFWSLIVLGQSWDFPLEKMFFGITAVSVKVAALMAEKGLISFRKGAPPPKEEPLPVDTPVDPSTETTNTNEK